MKTRIKMAKRTFLWMAVLTVLFLGVASIPCARYCTSPKPPAGQTEKRNHDHPIRPAASRHIKSQWLQLTGNAGGKVVFARPPAMLVLYLDTGKIKQIPGIVTAGAKGRNNRGKSPRPSWAPDGKRFSYRYNGRIYVSDEEGNTIVISHPLMDCGNETRWSWHRDKNGIDWLVGPSKNRDVIMVNISQPAEYKTLYNGGDVVEHCELSGSGHVVYDNGKDIYVTAAFSNQQGIKISHGQNCRPCASPNHRIAWLPNPHTRYFIFDAATGKQTGELKAPPNEEIYRLNWSNHPDYAVHMFGSNGNTRMHVRQISTGAAIFIGNGWDPDLWVQ